MSLQVPLSSHTNQVNQWSSFEVHAWIAKNNEKFGLNQDDLDSIEESPISGKQLMDKDDEQLSQEWAISIHAARKIVKKAAQIQRRAEKRKSEPIINILNGGILNQSQNTSPNYKNSKASTNPSLANIPEEQKISNYHDSSISPKRILSSSISPRIAPRYNQQIPPQFVMDQIALSQTTLVLTIKNDTFMGRLSHPKWWMDGHFNYIPNKIGCKQSVSINITGDVDTPLVGLLSFTLTLDPRYTTKSGTNNNIHAFSPYLANNNNLGLTPNIPPWMVGPGGLPFVPPSVGRLYELQHEYINKMNESEQDRQQKKVNRERKRRRKEERMRMKQQAKEQRLKLKREKRRIKREEKERKQREEEEDKEDKEDKDKENVNTNLNDENDNNSDSVIIQQSDDDDSSDDSSDDMSSESDYSAVSDLDDDDEIEIEEPPKYRLIVLWSITAKDRDVKIGKNKRDNIATNSMAMMSVASSDLLHSMNRFNVLLLEDDTDPDGPDEFNLDNSYFNELEQAALIADIEQCLVEHEYFEIAATFGTSPISNTYTLQIDIDDSLGDWPGPLPQFNSSNPFALGFMPTNNPYSMMMPMMMNPYYSAINAQQQQQQQYQQQHQQQPQHGGVPNITMIKPPHKHIAATSATNVSSLLPPKRGSRSRSNSQPVSPPIVGGGPHSMPPKIPQRLSKMFTLNDVLSVSRSPIPEMGVDPNTPSFHNALLGYNHSADQVMTPSGRTQWRPRGRKNSHATKAPRLSLWKEQISNLHQYHSKQQQQQQQQQHKANLFVPGQNGQHHSPSLSGQSVNQNGGSPSISPMPSLPPTSPTLDAAQTLPVTYPHNVYNVQYNIGDCVFVDDSKLGQIKSIGQHPAWGKGTYYGIRLTEKIGTCDGEYKGQRTFSCPPGYGYFVQRNQLTQKLKTTRFDFMDEDYIEDKKKEFEKMKAEKQQTPTTTINDQFAAEIFHQQQQAEVASDEDPGESDIPKPGTNVAQIMGQSSSERILSKSKPSGKYTPKFDGKQKKEQKKEAKRSKNTSSSTTSSGPSHRRQRSNSNSTSHGNKAGNNWTGGAPRTVVVRNKIPPIKEHQGYLHCLDGVAFQRDMEWKKAIEKFKLGIALLEVTLTEIDRSMTKRKWKAQIEEFRHKMSRCTFEIQSNKRNRFIKKRNAIAKKQAEVQAQAELKKQAEKMKDATSKVMKREDHWKVTREDMEKKVADHAIDPNYDPSTGMRPDKNDSDSDEAVNSGRIGGDKTLAKAKKEYRKKKKKKGKKGKDEDWSNFPGYENSGKNKGGKGGGGGGGGGGDGDSDDEEDEKTKKMSKHDKELYSRIEGDVMTADPDVSFADVVGLNNVKLALYETIILPYIRPDLFESVKKSTQGLLLFGPPGNGKTMIAKCVAAECDATFFSISASSITSKFVGEAERIMRTLFNMARDRAPSIIFIDEIDSLLRARGGANEAESSRRIKTEFLIQFDGVKTAEAKDKTITIIGATNLPDQLDDAVLRRFPKRIMVPNPDAEARYSLIRLLSSKHRHALSEHGFRELADKTDNYSCSDIAMLCNDAAMGPLRSMKGAILLKAKKSDIPKISLEHFKSSLKNVRASCAPSAIQFYVKWDEQFGSKLFLTMDVLPENMKQKPLLAVEEEIRSKQDVEEAKERAVLEEKQSQQRAEQEKLEKQRLEKEEQQRILQKDKEKTKKLLTINASPQKGARRKSENIFTKSSKKTKSKKKYYDDSEASKAKTSNSGGQSQSVKKQHSRQSGSYQTKPKVLNPKTIKISSSFSPPPTKTKLKSQPKSESPISPKGHKSRSSSGHVSSPSLPESFADKKRLWHKRSSKSGTDKKKKVKK